MTDSANPLQEQLDAAIAAQTRAKADNPPEIVALCEQQRLIGQQLRVWQDQVKTAVEGYNQARFRLFFERVTTAGQAWCQHGRHLVPANQLRLMHHVGAYVSSGYYETLRDYSDRHSICIDHALALSGREGPGRYEGEYSRYIVEQSILSEWLLYFEAWRLTGDLADQFGIPPKLDAKDL